MNLGTELFGASIYDHLILIVDTLILIVIVLEGPWYARKQREAAKAWRKFTRDTKKFFSRKEEEQS